MPRPGHLLAHPAQASDVASVQRCFNVIAIETAGQPYDLGQDVIIQCRVRPRPSDDTGLVYVTRHVIIECYICWQTTLPTHSS
jgi:hypothetical protein